VSSGAPPGDPAARRTSFEDIGRAFAEAARGGAFAVVWVVVVCLMAGVLASLLVAVHGLRTWLEVGLLTAALAFRGNAVATVHGTPILPGAGVATFHWRIVPMLLTIGFLWLAARAGRRAAEGRPGRGIGLTVVVAAAGAALPAAAIAVLAAVPVSLSFPEIGARVGLDVGSVALWAGVLAGGGATAGAFLRLARGRSAAVLRGGLAGYGWGLVLLAVGTVVIAALEPRATRVYVDELVERGAGGALLLAAHLLAWPAQNALLLAPAAGACLRVAGDGQILSLCPWQLVASGPAALAPGPHPLTPWLWLLNVVPPLAAVIAGWVAARASGRSPTLVGALGGATFGALAVGGAWLAAPRFVGSLPLLASSDVWLRPDPLTMTVGCIGWGLAGGVLGGWFEGRRYGDEPDPPRRTSL
jgi:hypothetical protein